MKLLAKKIAKRVYCVFTLLGLLTMSFTAASNSQILRISPELQQRMEQTTYHPGCPVPLKDLRLVQIPYWGFDDQDHLGSLIVHKTVAKEIVQIFQTLYVEKFPIERMQLIEEFNGNDDDSMEANNTSAFNCREITGRPGVFSQHSFGHAIDINPKINPYVRGTVILPLSGAEFVDRSIPYQGKITKDSLVYQLFTEHGWDWGGNWTDLQDYQHFEKRDQGRREP